MVRLLLAAYDEKDDVFRTACKCGPVQEMKTLAKLPEMLENTRSTIVTESDSKIVADTWLVLAWCWR